MLNKGIGMVKTATLGAALGGIFGTYGYEIGAAFWCFWGYGNGGKVSQVPAGRF